MATLLPSDYRFTVDEAGAGAATPGLSIVCEPLSEVEGVADREAVAIRLLPGTTVDEARRIASALRRSVGGFCRIERTGKG